MAGFQVTLHGRFWLTPEATEAAEAAIERARKAGYSALVITVDTAVAGLRERDHRNGMKEILGTSGDGEELGPRLCS